MSDDAKKRESQDDLRGSNNYHTRQTKFTPENIRQIVNLVERGKSKEQIAEIIGVTVGTLQVTCSKLGISLRQPRFNTGTGIFAAPATTTGRATIDVDPVGGTTGTGFLIGNATAPTS
jgi:hypothetical protein